MDGGLLIVTLFLVRFVTKAPSSETVPVKIPIKNMEKTLQELHEYVGGTVVGDPAIKITGVMGIDDAQGRIYYFYIRKKIYGEKSTRPMPPLLLFPQIKGIKDSTPGMQKPLPRF